MALRTYVGTIAQRLLLTAVVAVLAACSSSPTSSSKDVRVTDSANGQSVQLTAGAQLTVTLRSTYWQFSPVSDTAVLEPVGQPSVVRNSAAGCPPGFGCGSIAQSFRGRSAGSATVTATRGACGEAKPCTPEQSAFRLLVTVH